MSPRMNYYHQLPDVFGKLTEVSNLLNKSPSTLEKQIVHLVHIRASQINGCIFCLDMHVKEAKLDNEKDIRLHHLAGWEESPLFTPRERAALKMTEALTKVNSTHITDSLYGEVKEFFNDKEMVELVTQIAVINTWNRLGITFRPAPGSMDKMMGLDKAGL